MAYNRRLDAKQTASESYSQHRQTANNSDSMKIKKPKIWNDT
nr:MAG TPA: hypothetical protein [Bacteriophage sp.]